MSVLGCGCVCIRTDRNVKGQILEDPPIGCVDRLHMTLNCSASEIEKIGLP